MKMFERNERKRYQRSNVLTQNNTIKKKENERMGEK